MKKSRTVKIKDIIKYIESSLFSTYDSRESLSIAKLLILDLYNISTIDIILNIDIEIDNKIEDIINERIIRLKNHEPIQYVIGYSFFCGLKIAVNSNVLIPRSETEELVEIVSKNISNNNKKIIDICTGSGCIALALKNRHSNCDIYGLDISSKAIELAILNSKSCNLEVNFFEHDILKEINFHFCFDIIVSNPPYVLKSSKNCMLKNVVMYEPESAIFVNDDDPTIFYRAIMLFAKQNLKIGGQVFLEINEDLAKETSDIFHERFTTEIRKDINEKNRFIVATLLD